MIELIFSAQEIAVMLFAATVICVWGFVALVVRVWRAGEPVTVVETALGPAVVIGATEDARRASSAGRPQIAEYGTTRKTRAARGVVRGPW